MAVGGEHAAHLARTGDGGVGVHGEGSFKAKTAQGGVPEMAGTPEEQRKQSKLDKALQPLAERDSVELKTSEQFDKDIALVTKSCGVTLDTVDALRQSVLQGSFAGINLVQVYMDMFIAVGTKRTG